MNCAKLILYADITKKLIIFPLFTPDFPFEIHNCRGTFFEKGGGRGRGADGGA